MVIVERIRKLLALARDKGATEAEAMLALEKASALMREYNIDQAQVDIGTVDFVERHMPGYKWEPWTLHVAMGVALLYRCKVSTSAFSKKGGVAFHGLPLNTEACEDTFLWVCQQIEGYYKESLRLYSGSLGKRGRAELRATFKPACALRIRMRCAEIEAKTRNAIPNHMSLVVVDTKLDEHMHNRFGHKRGRDLKRYSSGIGTGAGLIAGDRVQLNREVK